MVKMIESIKDNYSLNDCEFREVPAHEGGKNIVYIPLCNNEPLGVIRISPLTEKRLDTYEAEADFVRFLKEGGAPVAGIIPSRSGKNVELIENAGDKYAVIFFEYAHGITIAENGYRYRENVSLKEYFYNTGKALGKIHALSKKYPADSRFSSFEEKYTREYIDTLIPDEYLKVKRAIVDRLDWTTNLPKEIFGYGIVHFDFFDGNYHIDMENGDITVYDFDNSIYAWYMYDLAEVWLNGLGWCRGDTRENRKIFMKEYFDTVLSGYRSETELSEEEVDYLSSFIYLVLIENITDYFESAKRTGERVDFEDIREEAEWIIGNNPLVELFS